MMIIIIAGQDTSEYRSYAQARPRTTRRPSEPRTQHLGRAGQDASRSHGTRAQNAGAALRAFSVPAPRRLSLLRR